MKRIMNGQWYYDIGGEMVEDWIRLCYVQKGPVSFRILKQLWNGVELI